MKLTSLFVSAALVLSPLAANAGGLAPVVDETPVVIEETPTMSPYALLIPLAIFAALAVTASSEDTDGETVEEN